MRHRITSVIGAGVVAIALAACGSTAPTPTAPTAPRQPAPLAPQPPVRWKRSPASPYLAVGTTNHGYVSFLWMDPTHLQYRFIPGTQWPEGSPHTKADRRPSSWTSTIVAAFDGGFKLTDHTGGYYYRGHEVSPLRDGLASLAVWSDGSLHLGVWGRDLHMTKDTIAVRQNLPPILDNGVVQTSPSDGPNTWGHAIRNTLWANRSALGVTADGALIFIFAHRASPEGLARELRFAGARFGMVLDMNGTWPAVYVYQHTGGHIVGKAINAYVGRPPSSYLQPYSKDFIAVRERTTPATPTSAAATATPAASGTTNG